MKKLILMFVMVAMVAVAAVPAFANSDFSSYQDQFSVSGDVNQESYVVTSGYGNVTAVDNNQFANTGNVQEQVSVIQYGN